MNLCSLTTVGACVYSKRGVNMKKLVILGFDGTIADTAPGILYCMNTTAMSFPFLPSMRICKRFTNASLSSH